MISGSSFKTQRLRIKKDSGSSSRGDLSLKSRLCEETGHNGEETRFWNSFEYYLIY